MVLYCRTYCTGYDSTTVPQVDTTSTVLTVRTTLFDIYTPSSSQCEYSQTSKHAIRVLAPSSIPDKARRFFTHPATGVRVPVQCSTKSTYCITVLYSHSERHSLPSTTLYPNEWGSALGTPFTVVFTSAGSLPCAGWGVPHPAGALPSPYKYVLYRCYHVT